MVLFQLNINWLVVFSNFLAARTRARNQEREQFVEVVAQMEDGGDLELSLTSIVTSALSANDMKVFNQEE